MIRPIHPVQDFKNLSTGKKVALTAATAGAIGLTIAAAIKGGKTLQGPDIKLLNKISAGYKEMYAITKAFVVEKGTLIAKKAQTAFETAKTVATEKGGKLKEKAQTLLTSLKEKLPQKAEEVIE